MIENNNLQQERYELERLQELYQLDQSYSDYKKTAAHVIGNDSGNWFSTFTIDKGSNDGIAKDMNVMAGSGLVGIVTDVESAWAKVRSIVDDSSNVSGMVLSTSDRCVVSGDLSLMSDGQIRFSQMENNDNTVSVGDQIVTSYISDKYLQGILIGYVSEVTVDSNNLTRSGYITPAVDFKNLQEVLIITSTKADLTGGEKNRRNTEMKMLKFKRFITTAVILLAAYLLQSTVFSHLELAGIKPNLLLIVTAAFGFMRGRRRECGSDWQRGCYWMFSVEISLDFTA